ncbi:hypothetical protein EDD37DRAFT_118969 [Exophiala viscosa]|uniref:uncharacterized protein n=1 Tax=Exophiala viscosa TaxID=2486360 RepID=UPI00218D6B79|nr:hypothetical protein EDD37DRAFT_118969 [Exophiala viscosa]
MGLGRPRNNSDPDVTTARSKLPLSTWALPQSSPIRDSAAISVTCLASQSLVRSAISAPQTGKVEAPRDEKTPQIRQSPSIRLFNTIKHRMVRSGIDVYHLNETRLSWCLPRNDDPHVDSIVTKLLESPLMVSDDELKTILALETDKWTTKRKRVGAHHFYIRSYPMEVSLFIKLSQLLLDNACPIQKLKGWLNTARGLQDNDKIWLRYCGTTEESVWERQAKVYHQRDSFYSSFFGLLDSMFPENIRDSSTYELSKARIDFDLHEQHINLREQALIALFGVENLLNGQTGGKGCTLSLDLEDQQWFNQLRTQTYSLLMYQTSPVSESMRKHIQVYVQDVKAYRDEAGHMSGKAGSALSKDVSRMMARQSLARTATISGRVPSAIIGIDPIEESFKQGQGFFENTGSASTNVVRTIINQMVAWELDLRQVDHTRVLGVHSQNLLPFTDMFPWPKKEDKNITAAMELTATFVQALNPINMLTFSHMASHSLLTVIAFKLTIW